MTVQSALVLFFVVVEKKKSFCYPRLGDEGSLLAWIVVATAMARPAVGKKNQGNKFSQYSGVTNESTGIFFSLLSMKYDIKIQKEAIWRFLRQNLTF